ncbi:MAG: winged helix DNA-binding protein [Sedimentisphaerales bacterium]|nr:winged helix DNA-binding protein [Sedimentisphaerales bacterium]
MPVELGKLIEDLGMRMRLMRAGQEGASKSDGLSERDILLLELLNSRGKMAVSEISAAYPNVSESTISTDITKLWKNKKLVSKMINPENQRMTFVDLTDKGRELLGVIKQQRGERMATLFRAMKFSDEERVIMERVFARAIEFFDDYLSLTKNSENRNQTTE